MTDPVARLRSLWAKLAPLPGGRRLFSRLVRMVVPYSGSVRARVLELEPGRAVVAMPDQRRVRNHLRSIHAVALTNVAELASGLAMVMALPPGAQGIVVRLETDYLKKARGTIIARGQADPPEPLVEETEVPVRAELRDSEDDVVARIVVYWRLRPAAP